MMKMQRATLISWVALAWLLAPGAAAGAQSEVPAGTKFLVELRDKLEAKKIKPGKKFEARTLEALRATDGNLIQADAKIKGRVSSVEGNKVVLRFEKIDTRRGWVPLLATATGVVGERNVKRKTGEEGEIQARSGRGQSAAVGAVVGAGVGAAVGASQGGGRGAAIGAATGAATGAVLGAAAGGKELVLREGARIELTLDRPLVFKPKR